MLRLKILYTIPTLGVGGAEILLRDLAIFFKNKGHDVSVMTLLPDADDFITMDLLSNRIKIIRCPAKKRYNLFCILKNIIFLIRHFKNHYYDIIHTNLTWDLYNLAAVNFFVKNKLRLITTEHNTIVPRRDNFFIRMFDLERIIYKQYLTVVCITKEVKHNLLRALPFLEQKLLVVENGVDLMKFCDSYIAKIRVENPIILCVGTLQERKDQYTLLRAANILKNITVWLVGDGPDRAQIESLVKSLKLQNRVFLLGKRNDIPAILSQATIYVQPSLYEGFGLAVLESMAAGLPVVGTYNIGLGELIDDVGLSFPVGDEIALAKIIENLLNDPDLLQQMSKKSQQKAARYAQDIMANKYLEIYINKTKES